MGTFVYYVVYSRTMNCIADRESIILPGDIIRTELHTKELAWEVLKTTTFAIRLIPLQEATRTKYGDGKLKFADAKKYVSWNPSGYQGYQGRARTYHFSLSLEKVVVT